MAYKIFISTNNDPQSLEYLRAVQNALFKLSEFPISAISVADLPQDRPKPLTEAKSAINNADIFIGIYTDAYGNVPAGATQSQAEQLYHYAHAQGKMCLVFMKKGSTKTEDARQRTFLEHMQQHHIIHLFIDVPDLTAKVILAVNNYKVNRKARSVLRPPAPNFREKMGEAARRMRSESAKSAEAAEEEAPVAAENIEAWAVRGYAAIEDEMEQLIRRSLELHEAQNRVQQGDDNHDGYIRVSPIFGEPIRRSQFQSDVFMVMPFRERFNTVYQNIIQPVVTGLNLTIKRGDEFSSISGSIMQEVWAALNACKLVIAETTEINANVYYELGVAHTLGKPAILLTQTREVEELPFDIRHLRFLVYEDSIEGAEKLQTDLQQMILWLLNDLEERNDNQA